MIAILDAKRAGLLRREHWLRNIIAGLIVGVVSLPLSMAFAIASGVKPEQGLYTAIIAGLIVTLVGGSRVQIAGPTGAFIVILAGIVREYGVSGLQVATVMAGIILVLMGLFRMGAIIRFVPAPVITGFTAGIGVIIWTGQWPSFFGIPDPEGEHFHQTLPEMIRSLPDLHLATTALAALGLALVIFAPKLPLLRQVPGPLTALVFVTVLYRVIMPEGVATIGNTFGGIPTGLPTFAPPSISADMIVSLLGPAFTIAMLGAIESLLSAAVADGMTNTRHDSNQELVGQGIANVASASFGGIAATGAIARTATNIRNGGNSPIAGIANALTLVAVILVLAPLAADVPLAVLAAILFVVSWNMSDVPHFVRMARRAPMADVAILLVTFGLTVFADLVVAVNAGVLLATLHFLRRMSTSVEIQPHNSVEADARNGEKLPDNVPDDVLVYSINGPIFFAAVDTFERALASTHTDPRALVLRLGRVPFIDITGIQALEEIIDKLRDRNVDVILCEANTRVEIKLERAGIIGDGAKARYTSTLEEALSGEIADRVALVA
ncbi:MAG TPA: SulP family inorganic anion transporter [Thermomicrobiales bacterium]|nr:SulP family inorganic anion transporter [Thermomicrobiales bacterium]